MPAKSKSQQRLMGMAYALKTGEMKKSDFDNKSLYKKVKKLSDNMSKEDLKDYAETSHKNLPDKKEQVLRQYIKHIINEYRRSFEPPLQPPEPEIDGKKVMKKFNNIISCLKQALDYTETGDIKYAIEELEIADRRYDSDFVFEDIVEMFPEHEDNLEPASTIIDEGPYKPRLLTIRNLKKGIENLMKILDDVGGYFGIRR